MVRIDPVIATVPDGARLIDIRWALDGSKDKRTYLAGHLPGAVYVDLTSGLAAPARPGLGRHPLPEPEAFAETMAHAGVGDASTVVVYDDADGSQASRLGWMLRSLGVEAAVLDGGLTGWLADGGAIETGDVVPQRARFTPRPWDGHVIATPDEAASGRFLVIDARAPERYRGDSEPVDPRAGHIPGAVNVPYAGNTDETGRFLAPEVLRARFAEAGVGVGPDDAEGVIVYCGSGVTATCDLLALERAGLPGARLLPGSWSQWSSDPARPVATGPQP